ncbi:MAG: glycosyltransferase family 4 protein [Candidatus Marinimicrobia bacterium]|nr:glycosyltransferase family 4 protein [Candidatus Neomarinimicrobiota bacterium]
MSFNNNNKKSTLFIYTNRSSFVQEDEEILSEFFELTAYYFRKSKKFFPLSYEMIKLFFFSLFKIPFYDIIYCWFADYHSLFPILFGYLYHKKTFIISGGYDAVVIPEIHYGSFLKNNFRAFCARYTFKYANFILPVDKSLIDSKNFYASKEGIPVGIKHFVKNFHGQMIVVPTGYDPTFWFRYPEIEQKKSVITIATVKNMQRFRLKGLDVFLETAKLLPETEFYIVGPEKEIVDFIRKEAGPNVYVQGFQKREYLPKILSGHKVYAQFSLSEGLPNTLCEAMLCECIPVGSKVNGITEAIGECGFILEKKDPFLAATLIQKALQADPSMGHMARERIIKKFPKEKRKEILIKLLKET